MRSTALGISFISSCAIHGIVILLASVIIHHRHLQFALDGAVGRSLRSVGPKIQATFGSPGYFRSASSFDKPTALL